MAIDEVELAAPLGADQRDAIARQIRGSFLLLVGQMFALGIGFAMQVIVVRYLSKSGFGAWAYALSVVALAQTLVSVGLTHSIARVIPVLHERAQRAQAVAVIALATVTIAALGAILTILVAATSGLIKTHLIEDHTAVTVIVTLIVLAPMQALDELFMNLFAVFNRVRSIFFRTYVIGPLLRLGVVLYVIATGGSVKALAVGTVATGAAILLIYGGILWRTLQAERLLDGVRITLRHLPTRMLFAFAFPLFLADMAYVVMTSADAILLGHFRDATEVASFRAVQPAARLNEIVFASFMMLFTPLAARMFARGEGGALNELYWQSAAWITLVSFPILGLTLGLARPLSVALFGDRYAASATYLAILSLGYYTQAAFGFNGTTMTVFGRTGYVALVAALAVAINLSLNLVLIPAYGALGAAVGTATALVAHNVLKQVALRRVAGISLFNRQYTRVYASVAIGAVIVTAIDRSVAPRLLGGIVVVGAASVALFAINRKVLRLTSTFPELRTFGGNRFFG